MRSGFADLAPGRRWVLAFAAVTLAAGCSKPAAEATPPAPAPAEVAPLAREVAPAAATNGVPAAASEGTGWIAFVRESDHGREVRIVRPDGRDEQRLPLPEGATGGFPSAALPGGGGLVGVAVQDVGDHHAEQLVLWSRDGKSVRAMGPSSPRTRNPVPSPDGKRIAFESGAESFSDLYVIGVDGEGLKRLTSNTEGNFEPHWSPDGTSLVFTSSRDGDPELYRMALDGGEPERLTFFHKEDGAPRWSKGGRIAFISNREGADAAFLMNPDGTGQRRLLPALAIEGEATERDLAFSPDGKQLAVVRPGRGGKHAIHLVDLETGEARALTDGKARDDQPVFSPDGRRLVFVSDRTGEAQLFVMHADGSGQTQLVRSSAADWRPVWIP